MDKKKANVIQRTRLNRGLTQEALAERTGYSADTIRVWESGARVVPLDALEYVAQALNASDWLPGVYLREQKDIFNGLLPEFAVGRPLAEAVAGYVSSILDLVEDKFDHQLLRMVADGRIDKVEAPDFKRLMEAAAVNNTAYYEMLFAKGAGKDVDDWDHDTQ